MAEERLSILAKAKRKVDSADQKRSKSLEKKKSGASNLAMVPNDAIIVVFGATGDLAKRKLIPGLFHLSEASLMPKRYHILGCAPSGTGTDSAGFEEYVRSALDTFARKKLPRTSWNEFKVNLSFVGIEDSDLTQLLEEIVRVESSLENPSRIFYLAVPPAAFVDTVENLANYGLVNEHSRLVIEKPFGHDLASARTLNSALHKTFEESQIYRIDHFVGRETVQNILAFRFANGLFEAVWNNRYVNYVQIDVPETLSIEGRASFYEATGAFRDMVVTHLFQILGFLAMEPPERLSANELHRNRTQVYDRVRILDPKEVIYGQYRGYKQEPGVARNSDVETLVALKAFVDNDRWQGVPWYLRTGKSMAESRCTVTLGFRESPSHMFEFDQKLKSKISPNILSFELSDPGSVTLEFLVKEPGPEFLLEPAALSFCYDTSTMVELELEAYERLFHDVMLGEHLLFNTADAIERLWEVADPILRDPPKPILYDKGGWGPSKVKEIVKPYQWYLSGS